MRKTRAKRVVQLKGDECWRLSFFEEAYLTPCSCYLSSCAPRPLPPSKTQIESVRKDVEEVVGVIEGLGGEIKET